VVPTDAINPLQNGGYYPLFQNLFEINYADDPGAYDPNIVDIGSIARRIFAKHTLPVYDSETLESGSYTRHLNDLLSDWSVNGADGVHIFTEESDDDKNYVINIGHSVEQSYSLAKPTWFYDAAVDGLISTGIPKDTQMYALDRTIIALADIGTLSLTNTELYPMHPVLSEGEASYIVIKPVDSEGNRMADTMFTVTVAGETAIAIKSRVEDGLIFAPYTAAFSAATEINLNITIESPSLTVITPTVTLYNEA